MKITSGLGKISLLVLIIAIAVPFALRAQSDNFDDGNDTANPTWTHYDPIGGLTGVPNGSWTFPGSNTYRLQAFADAVGVEGFDAGEVKSATSAKVHALPPFGAGGSTPAGSQSRVRPCLPAT